MKKVIAFLFLLMTISVGFCQTRGGSSSRSTSSRQSTHMSSSRSSSPSSVRTYSTSRSSLNVSSRPSTSSRTYSQSRSSSVTTRPSISARTSVSSTRLTDTPTYKSGEPRHHNTSGRPTGNPHSNVGHNPHPHQDVHRPHHYYHHYHHPHPYHHHCHHPHYHRDIYLHRLYWNPYCPVVVIDGFWIYTHNYYHVDYVTRYSYINTINTTMTVDIIDFVVDDIYTYCIERFDYITYFRVYDKDNRLVAQQKIGRKYKELVYDTESNGVWCMGKRDKDNLFFVMSEDEQLICYKE